MTKYGIILGIVLCTVATTLIGCIERAGESCDALDTHEIVNSNFRLRVRACEEKRSFGQVFGGAVYVYDSRKNTDPNWAEIIVYPHDDPNPIKRDSVVFLTDNIAFAYSGSQFVITQDAGTFWQKWLLRDAIEYNRPGCFIDNATVDKNGTGYMFVECPNEKERLFTTDYGKHWNTAKK